MTNFAPILAQTIVAKYCPTLSPDSEEWANEVRSVETIIKTVVAGHEAAVADLARQIGMPSEILSL